MNYETINDAKTALQNSGVYDMFDFEVVSEKEVVEFMYRNNATPDHTAAHFNVA